MVDEIPGKDLVQISLSIDIEIGVDTRLPKGLAPIPLVAMSSHQYLPYSPIPFGEQGLKVGPFGKIKDHFHPPLPMNPPLNHA